MHDLNISFRTDPPQILNLWILTITWSWAFFRSRFFIWLYVIMSRTSFRVNLHSLVCLNVKEFFVGFGFESRCCHLKIFYGFRNVILKNRDCRQIVWNCMKTDCIKPFSYCQLFSLIFQIFLSMEAVFPFKGTLMQIWKSAQIFVFM